MDQNTKNLYNEPMNLDDLRKSTGNPAEDNKRRKILRRLERGARRDFVITSTKGRIARKRKKYMYKVEREAYAELIWSIMQHLMEEDRKNERRRR